MRTHIEFHSEKEQQARDIHAVATFILGTDKISEENKQAAMECLSAIRGNIDHMRDLVTKELEGLDFKHETLELASKITITEIEEAFFFSGKIGATERFSDNNLIFQNEMKKLSPETLATLAELSHKNFNYAKSVAEILSENIKVDTSELWKEKDESPEEQGAIAPTPSAPVEDLGPEN